MQNSRRSMSKNNRGYVQDAWMYVTEPPVSCFLSPLSSPLPSPVLVYPLDYGAWGEFIRLGSGSCRRSDSRTWPLFSLQCLDVQTPEITADIIARQRDNRVRCTTT